MDTLSTASYHSDVINMSHRDLTVTPFELQNYKEQEIRSLLLNDNKLVLPPSEVELFQLNLCELVLDNNQLTMLPTEVMKCTNLRLLSLSGNNISLIPSSISQLKMLEALWLNSCKLLSLPDDIAELKRLERVGVERNSLTSVPRALYDLPRLKWLNLAYNEITCSSELKFKSTQLHYINLASNRLDRIPRGFSHVKSLQTLVMSRNLIAKFDDDLLVDLSHLSKIDMRDNLIMTMPPHWLGMTHILIGKSEYNNVNMDNSQSGIKHKTDSEDDDNV